MDHTALQAQLGRIATSVGAAWCFTRAGGEFVSFSAPWKDLPSDDFRYGVLAIDTGGLGILTIPAAKFGAVPPATGETFTSSSGQLVRIRHVHPRQDGTGLVEFACTDAFAAAA